MMDDANRAELEYLRERRREVRAELKEYEATLGEPVTESSIRRILAVVLEELRRSGNEPLADKFVSASERFRTGVKAVRRFRNTGDVNGAIRAIAVTDEAEDDLERVLAEVSACVEGLGKKGAG